MVGRIPELYKAVIRLCNGEQELDRLEQSFGVRSFATNGKQLELNGTPVYLRGYVDCCIFPLTGYPVWDKEHYLQQLRIARSYGFNHVRLHGWSAPEPFWEAADEAGMLVQAELPHWSRFFELSDQSAPAEVLSYLTQELDGLLQSLHRHPSFVMFSMGNELIGRMVILNSMHWYRGQGIQTRPAYIRTIQVLDSFRRKAGKVIIIFSR